MSESCTLSFLISVAGTPTGVTVSRTAATNVRVSWTAPSTGPTLGGYEVFYQTAAGSNGSNTTDTTTTELTLTGLVLGQTYSIFVVAFGPEGAPVLPSAHWQHFIARNDYVECSSSLVLKNEERKA